MSRKTVLITGAARRIGAAIAKQLHDAGMDIVVHHNTAANAAGELVNALNTKRPGSATVVSANLEQSVSYAELIDKAVAFKGRLDALVNNASVFYPTCVDALKIAEWHETINVNLTAPLFLSHYAANYLRQTEGCIINITDIHGKKPLKDHSLYSISKSGLITMTQSLAKELAPEIRVNAVSPGAITWPDSMDDKTKQQILAQSALKRLGRMDDISRTVLFFINDADYITGQVIDVDGGRSLF